VSHAQYVILEWTEELLHFPRYGFATIKHAEELGANVRWHDLCPSLEQAAAWTEALNRRGSSTASGVNTVSIADEPRETPLDEGRERRSAASASENCAVGKLPTALIHRTS